VPADSFFEWQKTEKGQKPKFEFTVLGSKPFGMTALWAP
jgi:putative SOS response-associated peptidase YedK